MKMDEIREMTLNDFAEQMARKAAHIRVYKASNQWHVELGKHEPTIVHGTSLLDAFKLALEA